MNITVRTPRTAPSYPQSSADKAAHAAATYFSPAGREALRRAEAATRRIRDDEFTLALNERGLNEYNDYVADAAA
jgi:hypothetical protein